MGHLHPVATCLSESWGEMQGSLAVLVSTDCDAVHMCGSSAGPASFGSCIWAEDEVLLQESWYEKLNRWDEALEAYERKYRNANGTSAYVDAALGRLR